MEDVCCCYDFSTEHTQFKTKVGTGIHKIWKDEIIWKQEESSDENKVPKAIYLGKIPSLCMTTARSLDTQLQLATVRMFWSASGLVAKCGKLAETRQSWRAIATVVTCDKRLHLFVPDNIHHHHGSTSS